MTNVKSLLEMYVKMGGSLTDTYSDIAGGVPVGQYSTISDAILACSKKYSAGGGGGAEKFVVTLTEDNETWTADKTVAEIVAADAANKIVVAVRKEHEPIGCDVYIPLSVALSGEAGGVVFCGVTDTDVKKYLVSAFGMEQGSDVWQVTTTPILTASNAPLIVTLTAGATEGQLVGDKTYKEAFDAFIAGRNVVFYAPSVRFAETVAIAENNTSMENPYALSTKSFASSGSANDYITITVGG